MRKTFSIIGAVAGVVYAAWGMAALYRHQTPLPPMGRIAVEFLVLAVFTAPLGGAVGLGLGLLLEFL